MTKEMIATAINSLHPGVYAVTHAPAKLTLLDGRVMTGYFDRTEQSDSLEKENKYTFVEMKNSDQYRTNKDLQYVTVIEGDLLVKVEYPSTEYPSTVN